MSFHPVFCPRAGCPSRAGAPFCYRHRGYFQRRCDGRVVQRFQCLACTRGFSEQTFRVNYRLKRPGLLARFFLDRISKVTHRQSARNHACSRSTEERHFRRLSEHCQAFHEARLAEVAALGGLGAEFLLDELETYEQHRTRKPLTVPVLIERTSGFVIDARVGTLPARKKSGEARIRREAQPPEDEGESEGESASAGKDSGEGEGEDSGAGEGEGERKDLGEGAGERRRSESRQVVQAAFERLREVSPKDRQLCVLTDQKHSYAQLLKLLFGQRCLHLRIPSTRRRDVKNPLWPINHTLARMRDNVSRLVRETWAAAKLRRWLAGHLAIWTCYRNYVRGRTNRQPRRTPAMALGVQQRRWKVRRLLEWRVFRTAA